MLQTFANQKSAAQNQLIPIIRQIMAAEEEPSLEHMPGLKGEPSNKVHSLFKEFLDERYEGGKKKVSNPNFDTREQWPKVSLNHAVRFEEGGKKPVWEKLLIEYQAWKKDLAQKSTEKQDKPTAEVILDKKIGDAEDDFGGTHPGGLYIGTDGKKRFVKYYDKDPAQAYTEHISNVIYDKLGFGAPNTQVFKDPTGRVGFASDWIPDIKEFGALMGNGELTKDIVHQAMEGFAADVLVADRDAQGPQFNNFVYDKKNNKVIRIDSGGSLLFRGLQGRKPDEHLDEINEWSGFSDHNRRYKALMNMAGYQKAEDMADTVIPAIDNIEKLAKETNSWKDLVEKEGEGLSSRDKKRVIQMLQARTKALIEKRNGLKSKKQSSRIAARWISHLN
jgi:hypothetical protein